MTFKRNSNVISTVEQSDFNKSISELLTEGYEAILKRSDAMPNVVCLSSSSYRTYHMWLANKRYAQHYFHRLKTFRAAKARSQRKYNRQIHLALRPYC